MWKFPPAIFKVPLAFIPFVLTVSAFSVEEVSGLFLFPKKPGGTFVSSLEEGISESSPAFMVNSPSAMVREAEASIPSPSAVIKNLPPIICRKPFSASSSLSACSPSFPAVIVKSPSAIRMLSLPERPCDAAVIV